MPVVDLAEGERAAKLYETIFLGYGDDSVAQLGGAHIACEWTSNLLTKILQRPRLAAYLEQSTRYIAYDDPLDGFGYRYHRDPRFGPAYEAAMDGLFAAYSSLLEGVSAWADERFPAAEGESPAAHRRAVRAKALDLVRGILPAASLSHVGIYATGQTYEQLVLHLLAHPLAEARAYGEMLLGELEAVMPSFVARVPRPDRGGRWIEYLRERNEVAAAAAARLGLGEASDEVTTSSVRLLRAHGSEDELLAALLYEASAAGEEQALAAVARLSPEDAHDARPRSRRHAREPAPPSRARLRDAHVPLRDRLRLRRVPRPPAPPAAHLPVAAAVAGSRRRRPARGRRGGARTASTHAHSMTSRAEYERLRAEGLVEEAPYALCLAYRIRYVLELDAREALHLIELRSGREGHPSYRAVALQMRDAIAAVHPSVAAAMAFVDESTEPRLERLLSEMRNEARAGR